MNTAKIMKFERPEAPTEGKRMEGGFIQIPNEVFKTANRCLKGNMKGLLFAIAEKTYGYNKQEDDLTIGQISECAGIRRSEGSPAFHALLEKKVISSRPGKFGFIVKINPVSEWDLSETERRKIRHSSEITTSENPTNVGKSDVSASENPTHNIQLPKDNTSSLSPSPDGLTTEGVGGDEKPKPPEPPEPPEKPKKKEKPKAPFEEIVAAYNEIAGGYLPRIQAMTDERRTNVNARWHQFLNTKDKEGRVRYHDNESGLKWWRSFFRKVLMNDRWTGASGLAWTADFDWIVKKSNFVKILEWRPAQHGGNGNAH